MLRDLKEAMLTWTAIFTGVGVLLALCSAVQPM
jgi:hypothetical protein